MTSSSKLLIEAHYLPSIAYFARLLPFDEIWIDGFEHYEKQTYRNRAYILAAQQVTMLSVPIQKDAPKVPTQAVKVDYSQRWVNQHWRSIRSAYGKAPFFEHYVDILQQLYFEKHKFLIDLNLSCLIQLLKILQITHKSIRQTDRYIENPENEGFIDLRSVIHPKKGYAPVRQDGSFGYHQVFGKSFVFNLSLVDLLFCEGNQALAYIHQLNTNN